MSFGVGQLYHCRRDGLIRGEVLYFCDKKTQHAGALRFDTLLKIVKILCEIPVFYARYKYDLLPLNYHIFSTSCLLILCYRYHYKILICKILANTHNIWYKVFPK